MSSVSLASSGRSQGNLRRVRRARRDTGGQRPEAKRERLTLIRMFEELKTRGYGDGGNQVYCAQDGVRTRYAACAGSTSRHRRQPKVSNKRNEESKGPILWRLAPEHRHPHNG